MNIDKIIKSAFKYFHEGNLQQAESLCLKIIKSKANNSEILNLLGTIHFQLGKHNSAIEYFKKSLRFNPANAETLSNIGTVFKENGQLDEAVMYYKKSLKLKPDFAMAYSNIGSIFQITGQIEEAVDSYKKALAINPNLSEAHYNLGSILKERAQLTEAITCFQKALQLNPSFAEAHCSLGNVMYTSGSLDAAIVHYNKALQLNPHLVHAYNNIATILLEKGCQNKAEECYRHALQIKPDFPIAYSNLLLYMNYTAKYSPQDIFSEHLRFAKQFAEPLSSGIQPHTNDPSTSRRLKIGYVSPDFRRHSVNYFLEPVLASHDHSGFEVFCYSDVLNPDTATERLRQYADQWRNIVGISDEKAAELVRKDGIDILIDLAGHTANNRMLLFARKPAPVQVSWLGYPNTTGLSTIDYRIVDSYTDPEGMTDSLYTEKLIRLPGSFLCYMPDKESPEVGELPALAAGKITFGSFNYFPKVSAETVALWAEILKAIPDGQLIMKAKSFSDKGACHNAMEMFEAHGISEERIELLSHMPSYREHLDTYNRIDICLDTFPYNGTTTTCEALWMGVPVITLSGNTHASRVGVSLLSNIGLTEFVAGSTDDYLSTAVNLAKDLSRLQLLRTNLRDRMLCSALTDPKQFIQNFENTYRNIWEKWCKSF